MAEPLAVLRLKHHAVEVWPPDEHCAKGHVRTVFADGAVVPAAPNGDEDLIDTAMHEIAHALVAELRHDRPSVCLRGVAEGHGRRWTGDKHAEETEAFAMGRMLAEVVRAAHG